MADQRKSRRRSRKSSSNSFSNRWIFIGTAAFIILCFLCGGSSRGDVLQLVLLRPIAIAWTICILCLAPNIDWRSVRWPGGLLLTLAAVMVLQLVPLPFSWWTAMPGREQAREALVLTGQTGTMHGWSLMPDRTLNSLFALTVPAAIILSMAALGIADRRALLPWLAGAIAANMLLGFLQLIVGGGGHFRPFSTTDMETAVGFFANRNHGAVLIAAGIPLAACLATWPVRQPARRTLLKIVSIGGMVLALLAILAIGSRSGLAMAVLGLAWAMVVAWQDLRRGFMRQPVPIRWAIVVAPLVVLGGLTLLAMSSSRDQSIQRLFDQTLYADIRIQSLPTSLAMMRDLFPFGSGFGTFEPMYRAAELRELLHLRYLNHAHNDYVELAIDAGLAGLVVLIAALAWFAVRTVHAFRSAQVVEEVDRRLAQAASGTIAIVALASITDYPIRTPIWMLVTAISAVWLTLPSPDGIRKSDGSSSR